MNLLTMKNLKKAFTDKVLFDGIDFSLEEGEKVGVIGVNGTGKSTLLRVIAGLEDYDSGDYTTKNNVVINYLPQNPDFSGECSVYDYVMGKNQENGGINPELEGEVKAMLNRLGFQDYSQKITHLSGGQKKKVALAAALLSKNEVLILDEPTNHLDNSMTEWLEEWLRNYKGALIMVTHDRYFLDLVCNRIVELDKGKMYSYNENYEGFLMLKAEREQMAASTQKKHENILRKEIAWISRGARARSTKQKAHIQRYEALRDEEKIVLDRQVTLDSVASRMGKKTVEINGISKGFGQQKLISDFSFIFLKNDRIGILGPNGCGKSTLVKMIVGSELPDSGSVDLGETIKIGYYAQDCESMDPEEKAIDYIKDTAEIIMTSDGDFITASQMLERFLFDGSLQYAKIGKLSGGERRRLYLCKVLMEAPNVLILDEPTNDLDISTLRILEDYLDSFPGIIIAVSHDRYFLDRVVTRMLTFEKDGRIELFNGTYTEYFTGKKEENAGTARKDENGENRSEDGAEAYRRMKQNNKKLKFTFAQQREYDTIEEEIETLEDRIAQLEKQIADPKISADFVKLGALMTEKDDLDRKLEEKMERYVFLEDLAEQIKRESNGV